MTKNTRDLARVLSVLKLMKFSILACQGVVKICNCAGKIQQFQLIFGIPDAFCTLEPLETFPNS